MPTLQMKNTEPQIQFTCKNRVKLRIKFEILVGWLVGWLDIKAHTVLGHNT